MSAQEKKAKILLLATQDCAYPGANAVGQAHMSYPENTYVMRVRAPVMFPEKFYMDCFKKGIYGIIIMSCGVECPYEGAYPALASAGDLMITGPTGTNVADLCFVLVGKGARRLR